MRIVHDQGFEIGRVAAARDAHRGDGERHIRPVLSGRLRDLGAANELERRLAVFRAGVEPGIVKRRPARIAHRVGDAQRRVGSRIGCEVHPHREFGRRLGSTIGFKPRDLAIDVALLALRIADRAVGAGDLVGDRGKRGAPFTQGPRLTLLAETSRRAFGEALGEFAPRLRRSNRAVEIGVLVLERLDALVQLGQVGRRHRPLRARVDRTDRQPRASLALDPQRGRIERQREILRHKRVVAGGKIERDDAGDGRSIGIDGDGVDRGSAVDIGRSRRRAEQGADENQAGRDKSVFLWSHDIPPAIFMDRAQKDWGRDRYMNSRRTTGGGETHWRRNWFDLRCR